MYVKITSGSVDTYPYSVGQLRRDNPQTSFPKKVPDELLSEYGVMPVTFAEMPSIDNRTQKAVQDDAPAFIDDNWTVGWVTENKTDAEIAEYDAQAAFSNRSKRDNLLAETDYFALTDVTMDAAMTTYRQQLRDITSHENWPNLDEADWPVKP